MEITIEVTAEEEKLIRKTLAALRNDSYVTIHTIQQNGKVIMFNREIPEKF